MQTDPLNPNPKKSNSGLSNAVLVLVLVLLSVQTIFFVYEAVLMLRSQQMLPAETQAGPVAAEDTVSASVPEKVAWKSPPKGKKASPQARNLNPEGMGTQSRAEGPREEAIYAAVPKEPLNEPYGDLTAKPGRVADDSWKWDLVELNSADSVALEALPWIGPVTAHRILVYRERLGAFAALEQLMEVRGVDSTAFSRFSGRLYIEPSSVPHLDLYTMSADSLSRHPYIGSYAAKGIVRLRSMLPREDFSLEALISNGILTPASAARLSRYL